MTGPLGPKLGSCLLSLERHLDREARHVRRHQPNRVVIEKLNFVPRALLHQLELDHRCLSHFVIGNEPPFSRFLRLNVGKVRECI